MADSTQPRISASLSLNPKTFSLSGSDPPQLHISLLLDYHGPITIFADKLFSTLMLRYGAFHIHYLSSGTEIQQRKRTYCRLEPPSKVKVELDQKMFHTLLSNTPYTLSMPFSGRYESRKPGEASDSAHLRDGHVSCSAFGLDGLEPGYDYILSLAAQPRIHWRTIRWWEHGTKDEVLYPKDATKELDGRKIKFGPGPHPPIEIDTSSIQMIYFRCEA